MSRPQHPIGRPQALAALIGMPKGWVHEMNNGSLSSRLGRLDKQLRRLEDRLAPPKQSEKLRLQLEDLRKASEKAAEFRAKRGMEPYPDIPGPVFPPGHKLTIHDTIAILNSGRDWVASQKKKRDAEKAKRNAEALMALDPGTDLTAVSFDSPVSPPGPERS
jgi:hypothetical protein